MDLSIFEMIARIAIGAIIGFLIGLTGIGGGVLVMPAVTFCEKRLHERIIHE